MPKRINVWLLSALILGITLRLVRIQELPIGFTPDEAAFGYNAYSILETGKDEWSTPWYVLPFTNMRSFGDYKLPLYTYLAVPSVWLFGLNEFAVRLPNAIFGCMAIVSVYLLAFRLFPTKSPHYMTMGIPELSAIFLALSPWHISLSRGAFEANLATFFLPLAIYFFLSSRSALSALTFSLGFYSYHSLRFLTPLIIVALLISKYRKSINKKIFIILVLVLCLPGLYSLVGKGGSRVSDVGIFSPTDHWYAVSDRRFFARNAGLPDTLARFLANKPIYILTEFTRNYLSYLSPQFLFTQGAAEGTYGIIPGKGLFYLFQLPMLVAFIMLLIRKPSDKLVLLLAAILISPLPASLAKGPGYAANRAVVVLPFLIIAISVGLKYLMDNISSRVRPAVWGAVGIMMLFGSLYFVQEYVFLSPQTMASPMFFGYKELFSRSAGIAKEYPEIRVSRSLSEPHIFYAFFSKYPPEEYQKAAKQWLAFESQGLTFLDQYEGYWLGNYRFGDLKATEYISHPVLYIGKPYDFPAGWSYYFQVEYPNSAPAAKVVGRNP